ncbi:MAG: hypothetical protein Fur0022_32940 [Anaerolineales bacterium]
MKKFHTFRLYPILASMAILIYALTLWARPASAASFTVNSTADGGDANPGNGVCETATAGECTLRAAIEEANALSGTDTIHFSIPGVGVQTISPASAYPWISSPVIIDGSTQPGASCAAWPPTLLIELDGSNGASGSGLLLGFGSNGSTIRGLVVHSFSGGGIEIANNSYNSIECNFLGTDVTGTAVLPNSYGVFIQQDSHYNTIGGPSDSQRNLISGNTFDQVTLGNFGSAPNNNTIQNNYIGTDVNGTVALGGGTFAAVSIFGGNTNSILDNLISGNSQEGILVSGDASRPANGNLIQGNWIGSDATGTVALANSSGIVLGTFGNTNVHNTVIGTNGDGANDASEGNLISGNYNNAIVIESATDNVIAGNLIGTDATGTAPLGNSGEAIVLYAGATNNRIGTNGDGISDALERNVISNSGAEAVWIISGSTNNVVAGNYIGTDATGTVNFGASDEISIDGSDNNLIGTDGSNDPYNANERNVIAGNSTGVQITNSNNTIVAGNYIGVDATGLTGFGNTSEGVFVGGASVNTRIGTNGDNVSDTEERNVIAMNGEAISLWGSGIDVLSPGVSGTIIKGNYIGVGSNGVTALVNTGAGIVIRNYASNSVIGGPNPGEGNIIANHTTGITMYSGYQNAMVGNSFFNNTTAIYLSLVGANDAGDPDTSLGPQIANMGQNYPMLSSAAIQSGNLVIDYSLDSTVVNSAYPIAIDFYEAESLLSGQGRTYLGRVTLAGPGSASANLGNAETLGISPGDVLVAMATDANGNTSLFSPVQVVGRVFTVNSTGDLPDNNLGNGVCETLTAGECTLRAAIQEANATIGTDAIHFNIPGAGVQTISPGSSLPTITEAVVIDGTTQPGANCAAWPPTLLIDLNGLSSFAALHITNGSLTLRGMVISNYLVDGVILDVGSSGSVFECNIIGADSTGMASPLDGGSAQVGIFSNGAHNNVIGGPTPSQRNLITGSNLFEQIRLAGSDNNIVQGNYIGTNIDGSSALSTGTGSAILVTGNHNQIGGSMGTTPGGACTGECNVIAGAGGTTGIWLSAPGITGNTVLGNHIGVKADGSSAILYTVTNCGFLKS